jgi:hypothetical protein
MIVGQPLADELEEAVEEVISASQAAAASGSWVANTTAAARPRPRPQQVQHALAVLGVESRW